MVQKLNYNSVPQKKKYNIFSKKKKSFFFLKRFSSKINLDIIFWKLLKLNNLTTTHLYAHDLEIKRQFYKFLKLIKLVKRSTFSDSQLLKFENFTELGLKLQKSGINYSECEGGKKLLLTKLKLKLSKFKILQTLQLFPVFFLEISKIYKKEDFSPLKIKHFSKGFLKFEKRNSSFLETTFIDKTLKKEKFLKFLKIKYFYTRVCESRILTLVSTFKKRYSSLSSYTEKLQKNIQIFFTLYPATRKKFLVKRKEKHRSVKKLLWKRKKRKKWKKRIFLRFLGFRKRFSTKFYVPKHLEINFKTLNLVYLGFTDTKTINPRLPFLLNLRKLVTFLSK